MVFGQPRISSFAYAISKSLRRPRLRHRERCPSGDRRSLFHWRPRSPGWSPSRARRTRVAAQSCGRGARLPQRREVRASPPPDLRHRRHRHEPGEGHLLRGRSRNAIDVIPGERRTSTSRRPRSPRAGHGGASVTLDPPITDSLSTEWDQPHARQHVLRLAALEVADEVPVKRSPQRSCLASRSARVFSPTSLSPASASAPRSSAAHILDGGQELDLPGERPGRAQAAAMRSHLRQARAHELRVEVPTELSHARPAWRPVAGRVAAVGEEQLGVAARAEAAGVDPRAGRAPRARREPRAAGRGARRATSPPWPRASKRLPDLGADLVGSRRRSPGPTPPEPPLALGRAAPRGLARRLRPRPRQPQWTAATAPGRRARAARSRPRARAA